MRKVYILPNLFTAGSLFCGVLSLFETLAGDYSQACLLIVIGGFLDVFDGAVARLTRSTSAFGVNFDSLADLVSFGVAPSLLAYQIIENIDNEPPPIAMVKAVCSLFVICSALRLARFNVQSTREESKQFTGLPTPAAAGAIVALAWVAAEEPRIADLCHFEKIIPTIMVIIAYLMVSKLPFVGVKTIAVGRQPFEILVTCVVIACLIYMLRGYMHFVLLFVIYAYLILSVISGLIQRRNGEETPEAEREPHSGHE